MYGTYWSVHRAPEASDDRRRVPVRVVVPRPAAEPLEPLEAGPEDEHDADAGQIAEIGAETDVVLDEQRRPTRAAGSADGGRRRPSDRGPDAACTTSTRAGRCPDRLEAVLEAVEAELEPAPEHARLAIGQQPQAVVVGRRAPELETGPAEEGVPAAAPAELRERPGRRDRRRPRASALEHDRAVRLDVAARDAPARATRRPRRQRELLPRDLVAGRCPVGRAAEEEAEGDEPLSAAARGQVESNVERCRAARRREAAAALPRRDDGAVGVSSHVAAQVGRGRRSRAGSRPGSGRRRRRGSTRTGCDEVLELEQRRMRRPVGPDEAVGAEVRVVRLVAEVAAVGPVLAPVRVGRPDPVVDPLPDEAALEPRRGARTPRSSRRARRSSCPSRASTRTGSAAAGRRPLAPRPRCRRSSGYIGQTMSVARAAARPVVARSPLVVERPRRVAGADPAGGRVVVRAVAALVAERPEDHARMVLVALDHVRARARGTRSRSAGRGRARRSRRASRCSPRRRRRARARRRGRASTGRSGSASVRTALTLSASSARASGSISSRETARPCASSCSWRLTPRIRIGLPLTSRRPSRISIRAEADAARQRLVPVAPATTSV